MRRRFSTVAVASSDGIHTRIAHDRAPGTGERIAKRAFVRCGYKKIAVTPMQAAMLAPAQRMYFL